MPWVKARRVLESHLGADLTRKLVKNVGLNGSVKAVRVLETLGLENFRTFLFDFKAEGFGRMIAKLHPDYLKHVATVPQLHSVFSEAMSKGYAPEEFCYAHGKLQEHVPVFIEHVSDRKRLMDFVHFRYLGTGTARDFDVLHHDRIAEEFGPENVARLVDAPKGHLVVNLLLSRGLAHAREIARGKDGEQIYEQLTGKQLKPPAS